MGCNPDYEACDICKNSNRFRNMIFCNYHKSVYKDCSIEHNFIVIPNQQYTFDKYEPTLCDTCSFCDKNEEFFKERQQELKRIDLLKQIKKLCDESEFTDEHQIIMEENKELKNKINDLKNIIKEQNNKYKVLETETKLFKEKMKSLIN
jgi:hypothetical protein